MSRAEFLIKDLPDPASARRFLDEFTRKDPKQSARLQKKEGLFSDVLTIVAYSPLLAATILQNPEYIWWLEPKRNLSGVRGRDALTESLARFSMLNSLLETQVLLSRFRRRELLRIFLRDIRRLTTIAEVTEEISNLADAILEYALNIAAREMEKRCGVPQETDEKGRTKPATFCIVSLGKLGSGELNYSSDIDLLFIYSGEGHTAGRGTHDAITNREYFVKLAERTVKLVGQQTGEGAAYRVDMRLRPHGRIGALALSLADTVRYYSTEARDWERQVLIRSRSSAGDPQIYKTFFSSVEDIVFSKEQTVDDALRNVRLSKEKIDLQRSGDGGMNVKLGAGGIREIEFIAQALQLAFGGHDPWLRVSHTLISLYRLAERGLINAKYEITPLSEAYEFLRHLEHILQMEHGLQTHTLPADQEKQALIARRMGFADVNQFRDDLLRRTESVHGVFKRVFGASGAVDLPPDWLAGIDDARPRAELRRGGIGENSVTADILAEAEERATLLPIYDRTRQSLERLVDASPHFSHLLQAHSHCISSLPTADSDESLPESYSFPVEITGDPVVNAFSIRLHRLRSDWWRYLFEIVMFDVYEKISRRESKTRQTRMAEATIAAALGITRHELETRYSISIRKFPFAVMGLGKLGGKGMDYGSDLDLVLVYDDETPLPHEELSHLEFYSRAVEIFVNVLSSMTAAGSLYRVDLRLRPYGKNGTSCISKNAFFDYLRGKAAIWEWLAYVKLRGVAGDMALALETETEARRIIHERSQRTDSGELMAETRRVRLQLEKQRGFSRGRDVDIKFGEGGMLDAYFLMRYLQLRDNVPDSPENRSTDLMLGRLREAGSLSAEDYAQLRDGYAFLSDLDHDLRLTIGRSTRVPLGHRKVLETIAHRMKLASPAELLEQLTLHRLNIRAVFDRLVSG
jgi:[glutamine synthetase] adenylyltransferase / [glutamine synthetase]-adenylyl-L-tyrosine phosphorylase